MNRRVEWSEHLGEWLIIVDDIGYRYFFDCRAEADEYLRLTENAGHDAYVWRRLGVWSSNHKHNFQCRPHWTREDRNARNN